MDYEVYTLSNGIRLIHKNSSSLVGHFGIIINTGSRDEDENEHGIAHLIEHSIFKGTRKRKAYHILSRLEDVGGDMNAYTTKEETCIYASFLVDYYKRTIELISDIVFNATFPVVELEREKEIVIDEINSYKDNPSELIYDEFEEQVFSSNSLGRGILGTEESLKRFTVRDIKKFIENKYNTDEIVLSSVGNISFRKLVKYVEYYFGHLPANNRNFTRQPFQNYQPTVKKTKKDTFQTHCVIGSLAYNYTHKDRLGLYLLNNLLGGPGMNSRLNLSLREKKGYTYNIESNYTPYSDTGIFNIYFGTDSNNLEKSINVVQRELRNLMDKKLGTLQLSKAKKQLIGQQAIAAENLEGYMLAMGKSLLVFNYVETIKQINAKIEALSASKIQEIANDIFHKDKQSILIYH